MRTERPKMFCTTSGTEGELVHVKQVEAHPQFFINDP